MQNIDPAQLWAYIVGALGMIAMICTSINTIAKTWAMAKKPEQEQNAKLKSHDEAINAINQKLANDNKRLDDQAEDNRLIMKSIMALLAHGLNGNNITEMQTALKDLQNHLIEH